MGFIMVSHGSLRCHQTRLVAGPSQILVEFPSERSLQLSKCWDFPASHVWWHRSVANIWFLIKGVVTGFGDYIPRYWRDPDGHDIFSAKEICKFSTQKYEHAVIELNQPKCLPCLEAIYVQLDMPLKPLWADYLRSLGVCEGPRKGNPWNGAWDQQKLMRDVLILIGGFKHFYFSKYMRCLPSHWLFYFSRWLKPPTSIGLVMKQCPLNFCQWHGRFGSARSTDSGVVHLDLGWLNWWWKLVGRCWDVGTKTQKWDQWDSF